MPRESKIVDTDLWFPRQRWAWTRSFLTLPISCISHFPPISPCAFLLPCYRTMAATL